MVVRLLRDTTSDDNDDRSEGGATPRWIARSVEIEKFIFGLIKLRTHARTRAKKGVKKQRLSLVLGKNEW